MKKIAGYFQSTFYNIKQNKLYALFCIIGTALTFIFVVLILQLLHIYTNNYPPMTHSNRIIRLQRNYQNTEGKWIGAISPSEINAFLNDLKEYDCVSLLHMEGLNLMANERLNFTMIGFVNADFWKMYTFEFLYGKPFSKEDCMNQKKAAVIAENVSLAYFGTKNSMGKKIFFQRNEYEITGIVKSFSDLSTPSKSCNIWVPDVFNKFLPSGWQVWTIDLLTPLSMTMDESKEKIAQAVQHYFQKKNVMVDFSPSKVCTMKEGEINSRGEFFFKFGLGIALVLFLLIPAINILSLSAVNTNNRAEEIAVRKTFGASRISSFFQIMVENMILVIAGALIGLFSATPMLNLIQQNVMSNSATGNVSLVAHIDYWVIFTGVLPAMIVFSLLSGGLPAYLISKRTITQVLKRGTK